MEINVRPNKWRKQWWRYNLIPSFGAVDTTKANDADGSPAHRLYEFVWMSLIIDVIVRVNRKEFKNAWYWPTWSD